MTVDTCHMTVDTVADKRNTHGNDLCCASRQQALCIAYPIKFKTPQV